jgi:hypothetical protein
VYVKLLDYREFQNERLMGTVRMVGGQLQVEGDVPPIIQQDLQNHVREMGKVNDETYLKSLELVFSGAYLKAKFIPEG